MDPCTCPQLGELKFVHGGELYISIDLLGPNFGRCLASTHLIHWKAQGDRIGHIKTSSLCFVQGGFSHLRAPKTSKELDTRF